MFDDCFLPLTYLRFERTIGNLVVPESMLFLLSFTKGDSGGRGCRGVEEW